MNATPLNPFVVYARAYDLDRPTMAVEMHVHATRIAAWQNAETPPKTACKLLALRVAQRRGKLPSSLPVSDPQRLSVYQTCKRFNITWPALAKILDRNTRLVRQKFELSKASAMRGAAPHSGDTLPSHEVWYVEILHHLVTQHGVRPPKGVPWPGGRWSILKPSDGSVSYWWVFESEDPVEVMRSRPADHVQPATLTV